MKINFDKGKTSKIVSDALQKTTDVSKKVAGNVGKFSVDAVSGAKNAVGKSQESIFNAIDMNGNGEIDIEDVIIMGLRVPGIKINRSDFLQKEFFKRYSQDVIDDAIAYNPLHANIPLEEINKIADSVIQYERNCVSGISAALGAPGGVAMVATIPADIAQYYGYMLRATQKLLYLYGFPEIDTEERNHQFDSETMNILILCLGVMYGAAGASNAIKSMAKALATGVEKQLIKKALTKGTIYPIVKSVSKWFGVKMTKEVFAGFFKKAIPVVGGVIGGGITYVSFKPCCDKLKASLQDTLLSNPDYVDVQDDIIEIGDDAPLSYDSQTKEQFDKELQKAIDDVKEGRVYTEEEITEEMKRDFGI